MKFVPFVLLALASTAFANTAPSVVIQSAQMRPGTTLMDVVYRVNDPDDATVKTGTLLGGVLKTVTAHHKVTLEKLLAKLKL